MMISYNHRESHTERGKDRQSIEMIKAPQRVNDTLWDLKEWSSGEKMRERDRERERERGREGREGRGRKRERRTIEMD